MEVEWEGVEMGVVMIVVGGRVMGEVMARGDFGDGARSVTETLVLGEGGAGGEGSCTLVTPGLGSTVGVHPLVTTEVRELSVALHADLEIHTRGRIKHESFLKD